MTLTKELDVKDMKIKQGLLHSQEIPSYEQKHLISVKERIKEDKIFIIDEPEYTTMLFTREY